MRGACRRRKGVALLLGRSLRSNNLSCIQNTSVSRIGSVPAFWADKNSRAAKTAKYFATCYAGQNCSGSTFYDKKLNQAKQCK